MELERPVVPCSFGSQRLKDKETSEAAAAAEFECAKKPSSAAAPAAASASAPSPAGGGGGSGPGSGSGPLAARRCDAGVEGDAGAGEAEGDAPTALAADRTRPCTFVGDKYSVLDPVEGSTLYRCVDVNTREELVCKVSAAREASASSSAHARSDGERRVSASREASAYGAGGRRCSVFERAYGDSHTHVRAHVRPRRGSREAEARRLFRQAAEAVAACHAQGVVSRDLKSRKFVFADPQRTELKSETSEDAVSLEDPDDDRSQDKRGCPAYVSPEISRCHASYSGRAADMWSLGVILYTMLVGRYPFNDSEHASSFAKISRGHFVSPDWSSARARCLIRSLSRRDPEQRSSAADVSSHPWSQAQGAGAGDERDGPVGGCRGGGGGSVCGGGGDQVVPECP